MKTSSFKARLELGEELLCFDGNTLLEKVTVKSVDKKAKTVTLSNGVTITRYPNVDGCFDKVGGYSKKYSIYRFDKDADFKLEAYKARYKLPALMQKVIKLSNITHNVMTAPMEDLELVVKIESKLSKILKDFQL